MHILRRILTIVLVVTCHLGTAYTLNLYIIYFGYAFKWGQEAVSYILSWLGISRVFALLFIAPAAIFYFERNLKRPEQLRHLTLSEIKSIAKKAPADEPPIESASEIQPRMNEEEDSVAERDIEVLKRKAVRETEQEKWEAIREVN